MDASNSFETLGQFSSGEAGTTFRNFTRAAVRHLIGGGWPVMASKRKLCLHSCLRGQIPNSYDLKLDKL